MTLRELLAPLAYPVGGRPSRASAGTPSQPICDVLNRGSACVRSTASRMFPS